MSDKPGALFDALRRAWTREPILCIAAPFAIFYVLVGVFLVKW